jgi:NADH-quinone oxidoreductase subunit L
VLLGEMTTSFLPTGLYATLPFWPLLGALLVGLLIVLRQTPARAHWPVVLGAAVSAALGITLFFDLGRTYAASEPSPSGFTYTLYNWMSLGARDSLQNNHWLAANLYFDGLTGIMLLFVTVVSLIIVVYSIGYMRDHHGHPERGYERFFAFLGLFVFSMCTLVLAGNFILLYLGWELVGLCSYLLIGFYYPRPSAAAAAKKAFIVNRIGDFGFAVGIFALYWFLSGYARPGENPLDYAVVFKYAEHLATTDSGFLGLSQATLVSLLLLCGAVGKSAQFPLYVWLPDAMEGPTPVSALIHAATMVTAGIYMVARCTPIFSLSPATLDVILTLGVIGAVLTATMAMAQYDMKRILAYSTISQLAFMFVGLGCRVPDSAVFHVFTHAWFKALLFLGAGSVMHAMGGIIDLRRFSGLRHVLPRTYITMWVGCLALAGFPLLAGFWSKDEIVHAAFERNVAVGIIMLATAGLTAYYTFRMFFLCFHGPLRLPDEAGQQPREAPAVMVVPLVLLAVGAVLAGYLGVTPAAGGDAFLGLFKPHGLFHAYIGHSTVGQPEHGHGGLWLMYLSALVALAGMALAWARYGTAPESEPDQKLLGGLWNLWHAKYYVDEIYDAAFVRPLRNLGRLLFATDNVGVDGLVWLVAAVPRGLAFGLHFLQRGALQAYAAGMVIGIAVLLLLWRWVM